jgi:hypothetical protein
VFSCRHLYHRQCVLDAIPIHGRSGPAFRHDRADWSSDLFCLACT